MESFCDNMNNIRNESISLPLISIIILIYKSQKYLFETIRSVLEQDYPKIELILSDDASGCLDEGAVENYIIQNKRDNIVSYKIRINKKNIGTVKHANLALHYANGRYIKFVPSGDKFFNSTSLSNLYKFADWNDALITSSVVMVCSEDFSKNYYQHPNAIRNKMLQSNTCDELCKKLYVSNFIAAVSVLFRRDFFDLFKFDERYKLLEDWPLWIRISREGIKIYHLNEVTMYYADGGISKKDGDAYASIALRNDMSKCYELEIMPFVNSVNFLYRQYIYYKYEILKDKNMLFYLKYSVFLIYEKIKYLIKIFIKIIR